MSRHRGLSSEEIFAQLTNIDENESDGDQVDFENHSDEEYNLISSEDSDELSDPDDCENSDSEREAKRTRRDHQITMLPSDPNLRNLSFTAAHGTVWKTSKEDTTATGHLPMQNVLKEVQGPTPFAKKNITSDSFASAWRIFIDKSILLHIKKCTEAEAHRVQQDETWYTSVTELEAFISILYARGVSGSRN